MSRGDGIPGVGAVIEALLARSKTWRAAFGEHPAPATLERYAEMDMTPAEFARVQAHLDDCRMCSEAVERHDLVRTWVPGACPDRPVRRLPASDEIAWWVAHRHAPEASAAFEALADAIALLLADDALPPAAVACDVETVLRQIVGLMPLPRCLPMAIWQRAGTAGRITLLVSARRTARRRAAEYPSPDDPVCTGRDAIGARRSPSKEEP